MNQSFVISTNPGNHYSYSTTVTVNCMFSYIPVGCTVPPSDDVRFTGNIPVPFCWFPGSLALPGLEGDLRPDSSCSDLLYRATFSWKESLSGLVQCVGLSATLGGASMCMCARKYQLTTRHQNTTQSFPCHMQVKVHPLGLLYSR